MTTLAVLWYGFWAGMVGGILGLMLYDYARGAWIRYAHRRAQRVLRAAPPPALHHIDRVTHRRFRDHVDRRGCEWMR